MNYRKLSNEEVNLLLTHGCLADNWSDISVTDGFSSENIKNTRFRGKIKLGKFSGVILGDDGSLKKCGIYDSCICNCDISDDVFISGVRNLTNYSVASNVSIEHVYSIVTDGSSAFGNGTEIEVLNEGGGRAIPIFDKLTSQIAYLAVLYRHDREFTGKLIELIRDYVQSKVSPYGRIESFVSIRNSQIIKNVHIGKYSMISGVNLLEDGTIKGSKEAPAFIGEGVIARKFIILSGSRVDGTSMIEKTFVGQGVKIGKQFSSENSLFFANSEAFHGEGCSVFGGPYTVTHHKSTLLIACLFSFYNAGSGTNQSNHMYKLGPLHQGIFERGTKTGSFAYLLLPVRIGAYSVVMGKHYTNFDSSDFPFSYITEEKGKSELTPGMNIFTVGTRRDSEKWATRDRRNDPDKLDLINFALFNPYIAGKILTGIKILNELSEKTPRTQDFVNYKGINIHRLLFKTSKKYYEMAIKSFIGQEIIQKIERIDDKVNLSEISELLKTNGNEGVGRWVDICGMFSPAGEIDKLMESVTTGKIKSIDELIGQLHDIHDNYDKLSWQWCADLIKNQTGTEPQNLSAGSLIQIINDWKISSVKFNNMILKDAEKEFDASTRLGFGIDDEENTRDKDFHSVRGEYHENKFVQDLQKEIVNIENNADRLIAILQKLS
jgi:hypothetical protein